MLLTSRALLVFRYAGYACLIFLGYTASALPASAQDVQYFMDNPTYVAPGGTKLQGVGKETFSYSSNPLLLTTGAQSLWGSITSPEAIFTDITPTTNISSDTIFSSNNFNLSDFNSNDVHSKLNLSTQSDKVTASFMGNVDYDTTRTSEFSAYNNIRTTPTRHLGETLTPQIVYNFQPDNKIGLLGGYTHSEYASSAFTDYDSYSITPTYTHNFDPLNAGILSFNAQRYKALTGPQNITDTLGPSVGWQKIFTERLTGSANIGVQETRQKTSTTPNPSWSPYVNYSARLNYKGSQNLVNLSASRSQYPFGNGTEALLTQLSADETYALNPKVSLGVAGTYQSATYQTSATGSLESFAQGSGSLIYHITDQVDLSTTYEYQYETLVNVSSRAHNHVGLVSLTFHSLGLDL